MAMTGETAIAQKLIDMMYEVAMVSAQYNHNKSNAEIATWVTAQLSACGFETEPCGLSWGVLK